MMLASFEDRLRLKHYTMRRHKIVTEHRDRRASQPFQPETGAYGGGHKHGHDETFSEDYALAQKVFDEHHAHGHDHCGHDHDHCGHYHGHGHHHDHAHR